MKQIILIYFFLLLMSNTGYTQEASGSKGLIRFSGIVMDSKTNSPLANTQIIINRRYLSVSDKEGKFAFYVNRQDTVVFTRLGYKTAHFLVSDTLAGREFLAGIYMSSDTLEIAEVIITPRLRNLKSELMNSRPEPNIPLENAKYNLALSAYQGRMGQNKMGDPAINYKVLQQKQQDEAYSKGQLPSDRIVGLSPFLLLPAAYLLINGFPDKPSPMESQLTRQEIDRINQIYLERNRKK
jgi:hypothetical protein